MDQITKFSYTLFHELWNNTGNLGDMKFQGGHNTTWRKWHRWLESQEFEHEPGMRLGCL